MPRPDIKPASAVRDCGSGNHDSVKFCHKFGLSYVGCSPYRVLVARLTTAQAAVADLKK